MTGHMWLAVIAVWLWVMWLIVNGFKTGRTQAIRTEYLLARAERQKDETE